MSDGTKYSLGVPVLIIVGPENNYRLFTAPLLSSGEGSMLVARFNHATASSSLRHAVLVPRAAASILAWPRASLGLPGHRRLAGG